MLQFSSVTQSCLTLCDSMDCSMPGFPIHHQLPGPTQTRVQHHAIQPFIPFSPRLQSFPAWESFAMSWFFASCGQSIGVSASASVLSMNIQGWFPLGLTGWISLQSKGLSSIFSNTTVQKHQFFGASFVAQLVNNLPEMRETWVWSLGWEDLLEKQKAIHSSVLA